MARLSNFFQRRDPADGCVCRTVEHGEIEAALRLLLADDQGLAGTEAVLDFLQFAVQRKMDLNQMWVAEVDEQIAWVLLPIVSPGRTMLLFTPPRLPPAVSRDVPRMLTEAVCDHWLKHDVQLAQFLLDPRDGEVLDLYQSCGFELLAELVYLRRSVREMTPLTLPEGFELSTYGPGTHAAFAQTIQRSYEGSLDCPSLNGLRSLDDVIAGHKSAGQFDPGLWFLLSEKQQPLGVLVLSPLPQGDAIELVYLGLAPQGRGRGLGDLLMRLALGSVIRQERSELSLAVDSKNEPALRLYFRHGLERVGSRLALLKDLHPASTLPQPQMRLERK